MTEQNRSGSMTVMKESSFSALFVFRESGCSPKYVSVVSMDDGDNTLEMKRSHPNPLEILCYYVITNCLRLLLRVAETLIGRPHK